VRRLREGSGHDMIVEVSRAVGELRVGGEGRVGLRGKGETRIV
jgi:hypothetical protein